MQVSKPSAASVELIREMMKDPKTKEAADYTCTGKSRCQKSFCRIANVIKASFSWGWWGW
jgi:hypothetical protein